MATKQTDLDVMSYMIPQNGVVEGPIHYGSADPAALSGAVGSVDAPKMSTTPFVVLSRLFRSLFNEEAENGSLPCTLTLMLPCRHGRCPDRDELLESETRLLIFSFLNDFTGVTKTSWTESKALTTMKRVVNGVLKNHRFAFNGMINKLSLDDRGDDASFVSAVATSLFSDGATNWGRVASLVAFGAVVSQYLKETGRKNCIELVGEEICTYLLSDQRDWLIRNNAWDGFVEFFQVSDPESTVRNTLMAVAGVAGIGATLALLTR